VFLSLALALAVFGLINAAAVAGGVWFGPMRLRWLPWTRERAARAAVLHFTP